MMTPTYGVEYMPSDPKGRSETGFRKHVFVCGHERPETASRPSCQNRGSLDLMKLLKGKAKEAGLVDVRVQKSGCLDFCEFGSTCVVYPEGTWYSIKDDSYIEAILDALKNDTVATEHLIRLE